MFCFFFLSFSAYFQLAGPGAMLAGGLFFAAFSGAIELYQHTKD